MAAQFRLLVARFISRMFSEEYSLLYFVIHSHGNLICLRINNSPELRHVIYSTANKQAEYALTIKTFCNSFIFKQILTLLLNKSANFSSKLKRDT